MSVVHVEITWDKLVLGGLIESLDAEDCCKEQHRRDMQLRTRNQP